MSEKPDWDGTEVQLYLTFKVEYKVNSDSYGGAQTLTEAMAIDVENAYLEPILTLGIDNDGFTPISVTWKAL